jgi:superfamily II DNA or RNA helicase
MEDSLYEEIRAAAARNVWSRGVELARADVVALESHRADEVVLRVAAPGSVVSPTVVLYPDDVEWECDCGGSADPCLHVAAAVIALRRAARDGRALDGAAERAGSLRYAFSRSSEGLVFERLVLRDGEAEPLRTTLTAVASGRVEGPAFAATPADQEVELALGAQRRGRLPRGILHAVLRPLASCPDLRLDGEPVRASAEPVGWRARLVDEDAGFRLFVEREPPVSEELGDGLVRCGDTLRPLGGSGLTGRELDELVRGRHFEPDAAPRLVTEVLPSLAGRIPVDIETGRLPDTRREPPRIVLDVAREGDGLRVLARLVYGDPPLARVDAGRLVPLGGPIPMRDPAAERRLERDLRERLGLLPGHAERLEDEAALELTGKLAGWPGEICGDALQGFWRGGPLRPRLEVGDDDFRLDFETEATGSERAGSGSAEAGAVIRAWREGRSLVPLAGGGFAPLPVEWLARHGHRVADLLAAREAAGRLPRAALPALAALCDAEGQPRPTGLGRLAALAEGFAGLPEAPLPEDCPAALRGYQREGVSWLALLGEAGLGALLADDMGLGKTLQALCALRGRSLVVAPTSVLPNWEAEVARFRPGLRVCLYHGPRRRLEPDADVVLTSYALLRLDQDVLAAERFGTVVLDEAQFIKNPDSQVARAARALDAEFRIALTGTPVENRLEELWSQLEFLNPGVLGSRRDFEERVARPVAAGDAEAAARLRARLRPFLLRRRKSEVARELPPRQDVVLRVALSETEREIYDAVRAASVPEVVAKLRGGGTVVAALEALLRLRQACCHPALIPGQEAERSAKLDLLAERLTTLVADQHRALVFSQWTSLLDRVEPVLRQLGLDFGRLDGSTRDRGAVLREFADPDGPPLLLLSLKAGGTGLNLTAADHVFLLDPWWNPFAEDQAADRAHRIGQTRPVLVHRLVAVDTVEERILALQERKRAVAEAALGAGGGGGSLTREDLLALLE